MKKFFKNVALIFTLTLLFSTSTVFAAADVGNATNTVEVTNVSKAIDGEVVPMVSYHYETETVTDYNSVPFNILVGPTNTNIGIIWLMAEYSYTRTWLVDGYGNRTLDSQTSPKIISGTQDFQIESLGDVNVVSETLASDRSSYSVRVSIKYTEPKSGVTYSKYQTYTFGRSCMPN